jgi:hypothetical protein
MNSQLPLEALGNRCDVAEEHRVALLLLDDGDFGDQATVERLERRADGLRRQIAEAQAAIAPPERRTPDPLEAASRHAHEVFVEVTRARMAEATEHTGPDCPVCAEARRRDAARDREDYAAVYGEIAR